MNIILLDLFSGIGGFSEGLSRAGFNIKEHYFSEIDKHAIAIYQQNFKEAIYAGSVTNIRSADLPRIDAITFGSPCQDFSLAGKRAGLEGSRSGLIGEAIRLIRELRPNFFIWENVKGVYSSNAGADYWAVIQAFADLDGYRLESQLLNTAWFLPQNRERIYLVGRLGDGSGRSIFPLREKSERASQGSEQAPSVRTLTGGGNSGGMHSSMTLVKTIHGEDKVRTIRAGGRDSLSDKHSWDAICVQRPRYGESAKKSEICPTIEASRFEQKTHVAIGAVRGRNPDNPKSRVAGESIEQMLEINENGVANTLTSVQKDNYVVERIAGWRENEDVVQAYQGDKKQSTCSEHVYHKPSGTAKALSCAHNHKLITPYSMGSAKPGRSAIGCRAPEIGVPEKSIRRLTEIECERLQGFGDNWTKYGNYGGELKEVAATNRYKCLGNAVTVDVVESVGKSLLAASA